MNPEYDEYQISNMCLQMGWKQIKVRISERETAKIYEDIHQPLLKALNNYKDVKCWNYVMHLSKWKIHKIHFRIIKWDFKKYLFVYLMVHFAISAFVTSK